MTGHRVARHAPWGPQERGFELLMNFWGGLRICFQLVYGTGRLPVQRIFWGSSSLSWKRRNSIGERVWWAGGRVEWAGGRF